ncbi:MAG: hypothetical protein JST30_03970 [Armatimonadetes bacterium]|nr:hypothetical protein [Armatimonadota bacterium]
MLQRVLPGIGEAFLRAVCRLADRHGERSEPALFDPHPAEKAVFAHNPLVLDIINGEAGETGVDSIRLISYKGSEIVVLKDRRRLLGLHISNMNEFNGLYGVGDGRVEHYREHIDLLLRIEDIFES